METSFCSLKSKCVINISDGKNLGNITDVIIDTCTSKVLAIVVSILYLLVTFIME